jgi:hypothetical protein
VPARAARVGPHSAGALGAAGCGKFRISDAARARLGNVGDTGIPRVLDLGQCNDTFSAIKIAAGLADALKCKVVTPTTRRAQLVRSGGVR